MPIAATIAVGVANTKAQGQNTTRIVTALIISPVTNQVKIALEKAAITIYVAHLSATPTIFALLASALSTSFIIL
ncbi:hypothetical protein SDC9_177322 [bioreactor metagenome]|uniref:Uncharacterized protein n=1 Tax=bioreactor metagenome TaxID=1076179 RepID=A0A645GVT8_9ZZZZ